jgi:hypothetical protein
MPRRGTPGSISCLRQSGVLTPDGQNCVGTRSAHDMPVFVLIRVLLYPCLCANMGSIVEPWFPAPCK